MSSATPAALLAAVEEDGTNSFTETIIGRTNRTGDCSPNASLSFNLRE